MAPDVTRVLRNALVANCSTFATVPLIHSIEHEGEKKISPASTAAMPEPASTTNEESANDTFAHRVHIKSAPMAARL